MRNSLLSTLFICFFIFQSYSQNKFVYKSGLHPILINVPDFSNTTNIVEVSKYLPKNFKKDGSVDYTFYLQKAINENSNISLPDFKILINDSGLKIPSNRTIIFKPNSKIVLKGSSKEKYSILSIENAKNVTIINPVIIGDRLHHIGKGGEWGMGINILSSLNVTIYNPKISNCWGDGIYINRLPGIRNSSNIKVLGGQIDNNRRNAISIISGTGITISDILLSNQNGTAPEGGLVLEPNNNNDLLENINIRNITTDNNNEMGIGIVLTKMIGPNQKNVSISIENHKDLNSTNSILLAGLRSSYKSNFKKINGSIKIINSSWNGKNGIGRFGSNFYYMPTIEVNGLSSSKNEINSFKNELKKRKIKVIN